MFLGTCFMGRTIPSWRMVVNDELARFAGFKDFLRVEDKEIFEDLVRQCKHYAPYASTMASVVKEVPLMFSMLFGQQKMIWELEKRLAKLESASNDSPGKLKYQHSVDVTSAES